VLINDTEEGLTKQDRCSGDSRDQSLKEPTWCSIDKMVAYNIPASLCIIVDDDLPNPNPKLRRLQRCNATLPCIATVLIVNILALIRRQS
jgi:hypothetical protein